MNLRRILGSAAFLLLTGASLVGQVITNVVPPLGSHADPDFITVKVYGNGFAPGNHRPNTFSADFNGTVSTTSTNAVATDGEIDLTNIPVGATTGPIHIFVNGNEAASPSNFVVISTNAYITNFTPVSGGNGTSVTVSGVHMANGNITNVSFNGKLSQGVTGQTANSITITAPNGVTSGPLLAISKLGASHDFSTQSNVFYSATNFYVAPVITGISPSNGRPGTNVTITGTNFTAIAGVMFGSASALSFSNIGNTSIIAVVPTNASTAKIQVLPPAVTPPLSSAFSSANFAMLPTIYSFSPGFGSSGTLVTVNGAGLNEKSPNPTVTVGAGTVTSFVTVSPNTLSFNVPATATTGFITITTTNGSITSTQLFYLPPTISSFAPIGGGAGTIVQINGSNFTNASAVTFNGVAASGFTVTNNSVIGAIVPPGVTSGTITVTTPGGSATSSSVFYAPPMITGFSPTHGLPGTNVTITGTSFTNATAVLFNGVPAASFVVTDNTLIGAVVPNGATTGPITVAAPGGTNASASVFTIDSTDLGVSVTGIPNPVFIGSNLVYTIVITNIGPVSASNVRLTNTLSPSVAFRSGTTSQGVLNTAASPIYGLLGTINNGASATVTLTVVPFATGSITNTAFVTSDLPDPNLANNTAVTTTTVWPLPFLSITNLMSNGLMQVSWPAPLSGFTLQFATNLSANIVWANDSGAKVVGSTNVSVIETNVGPARFFRLTN